jgi:hypothetical protein
VFYNYFLSFIILMNLCRFFKSFNNSSCGCEIRFILRSNFKGTWHNWEKVDSTYRDELFKEFKV